MALVRTLLRLAPAKDNVLGLCHKARVFTPATPPPDSFDAEGHPQHPQPVVAGLKPVITIPVPVQRRALKRQEKMKRER